MAEENLAQQAQNPEGYRYAVDCTWTGAPARVLAPMLRELWGELETEHSFSIWYGWARGRAPVPDMAFSVQADVYIATYVIYTDPAGRRAVLRMGSWPDSRAGRRPWPGRLPRRHRLHPAAGPVPVRRRVPPPLRGPRRARP